MKKKSVLALMMAVTMMAGVAAPTVISNAAGLTQATTAEMVVYERTTAEDKELLKEIFDFNFYKEQNPELVEILGDNFDVLFEHFCMCGLYEGRTCNPNFDPAAYASAYSDLRDSFGNMILKYYKHYITIGAAEERTLTTVEACADAGITVTTLTADAVKIEPAVYMFARDHGFHDYVALQTAVERADAISKNDSSSPVILKPKFGVGDYLVVKNFPEAYDEARSLRKVGEITITEGDSETKTYYIYKNENGVGVYNSAETNGIYAITHNNHSFNSGNLVYYTGTYNEHQTVIADNYVGAFNVKATDTPEASDYQMGTFQWKNNDVKYHVTHEYSGHVPNDSVAVGAKGAFGYDYDGGASLQPTTEIGTNYVAHKQTIDGVYTDSDNYRPLEETDNLEYFDINFGTSGYYDEKNSNPYDIGLKVEENGDTVHVVVGVSNTTTHYADVTEYDFPAPSSVSDND